MVYFTKSVLYTLLKTENIGIFKRKSVKIIDLFVNMR